jgi:hypothetical protein
MPVSDTEEISQQKLPVNQEYFVQSRGKHETQSKVDTIASESIFLTNIDLEPEFRITANRKGYKAYTLVDNGTTVLMTVMGIVSFCDFSKNDLILTLSLDADFALSTSDKGLWAEKLNDICSKSPVENDDSFNAPCRAGKMRFIRKSSDKNLLNPFEALDINGIKLENIEIFAPGDLVAVDFGLQVYIMDNDLAKTSGARLILETVQLIASKYDTSFEATEMVQMPARPTASRKRDATR